MATALELTRPEQEGRYEVTVEQSGFKKESRRDINVEFNSSTRVDVQLQPGSVNETVVVSGEAAILQTDRTDTGRSIDAQMIEELPLGVNRNFQSLLDLVPGTSVETFQHSQAFNAPSSLQTNVNGQPRTGIGHARGPGRDQHVFLDAQRGHQTAVFRHVADAIARALVDRRLPERRAVETDASLARRQNAHHRAHQRGLAGAIAADEAYEFSGRHIHVHAAQDAHRCDRDVESLNAQHDVLRPRELPR